MEKSPKEKDLQKLFFSFMQRSAKKTISGIITTMESQHQSIGVRASPHLQTLKKTILSPSYWKKEWERLKLGVKTIDQYLHKTKELSARKTLQNAFNQFLEISEDYFRSILQEKGSLSQEETLQDLLSIDALSFKIMYQAGMEQYEKNDFESAAAVFSLMRYLNDRHASIWQTLGIAEYQLKNFQKAIGDFFFAIALDPKDMKSFIYAIDSCNLTLDTDSAKFFLDRAKEQVDDNTPEHILQMLRVFEESLSSQASQ